MANTYKIVVARYNENIEWLTILLVVKLSILGGG